MVYIGVGGAIEGKINPVLTAAEGQVVQLTVINGEGAEHDIVFPEPGCEIAARHRQERQHHDRVPRHQVRRFHLFLQRARPSARRHAGPVHRHPEAAGAVAGRGRHLARAVRPAAADRQARPQDGAHRSARRRGRRAARGRHHLRLLDVQRQGAGAVPARAGRRHHRHPSEELGRQLDDPFGGFPCHHRTGRRRRRAAGRSRRREIHDLEGAGSGPLRLSLRHPDGGRAHLQRHVWPHPGRAGGGPAEGRSRVLRDAGRDLYRCGVRAARQPGVQRREAAQRAAGILRVQRLGRRLVEAASAAGQGRRDGAHLLRRRAARTSPRRSTSSGRSSTRSTRSPA